MNPAYRRLLVAAVLSACLWPVRAAGSAPSLDEVVAIALRANPDAREADFRLEAALADQRAAGAIPNPTYSIAPANPYQFLWSAPLDVGPQRWYRTRAAGIATEAARGDREDQFQQTVFSVRQAFYDVLLGDSLRTLALDEEAIVRQLVAADSARVASGDLSPSDLARSTVELAQIEAARARATANLHRARLALQVLMGVARPDTGFTVIGELRFAPITLPLDSLETLAMARRADLAAAVHRADAARALQELARSSLVPTPVLTLVHQPDLPFPNGSHVALGLSLEVPVFDWNGAARQRAAAELEIARLEEARIRAQVTTAVATAIDDYLTARTLASRYASGALDQARDALETVRYGYRRGSRSLLDLLDALRAYGQVRSDYYNAVHDYWVSAYALSRAASKELVP